MVMTYAAISLTGPGRAALLSNTYPLFVALFGALFFGERLRPRVFACIAVCSCGAALVMRDGSGALLAGDLLAVGSAVFAGIAVNFVKRATEYDNPFMLYLSPCLFGLPLFAIVPSAGGFSSAGAAGSGGLLGLAILVGMGASAFLAQALMAYGYRGVPAGRGSIVFYLETALTVLLGALFADERFNLRFGVGLALILGGLALNHVRLRRADPIVEANRL
jgi:drug/metabolite transporter (DMT)-like permease